MFCYWKGWISAGAKEEFAADTESVKEPKEQERTETRHRKLRGRDFTLEDTLEDIPYP